MTREVESVDQSEMNLSRRELMGSSAIVAGTALSGSMIGGAMAQTGPTNEISGTVEDTDGNAVDGATVVAVPHDSSLDALVTTTDANGAYSFQSGDLHPNSNLYHVVARDGTESDPLRSQQNYPFIAAEGQAEIPDSAIHRWPYDEGSGTTANDSIGSNVGTVNGATWTSVSDLVGGYGLSLDGTDDNIDHAAIPEVNFGQSWSVAVTIDADSTSVTECVWYSGPDGSNTIVVNIDSGEIRLDTWNGSSRVDVRSWSGMGTSRIRLGIGWDGSTGTGSIWANGSQVDDGSNQTSFNSDAQAFRWGENADSGGQNLGATLDNPVVYNANLSSSEWSNDYNAQPWS